MVPYLEINITTIQILSYIIFLFEDDNNDNDMMKVFKEATKDFGNVVQPIKWDVEFEETPEQLKGETFDLVVVDFTTNAEELVKKFHNSQITLQYIEIAKKRRKRMIKIYIRIHTSLVVILIVFKPNNNQEKITIRLQ
jgi:hypothetical protein